MKLKLFTLLIVITLVFSACGKNIEQPSQDQGINDPGGVDPAPIVSEKSTEAKKLLESYFDSAAYTVDLIMDDLIVKDEHYFVYLVLGSENAIEPAVAVHKDNLNIYCYNSDMTLTPFDKFPLYPKWAGNFLRENNGDVTIALIDNKSFNFSIKANTGQNTGKLTGVAKISGNTATFDDTKDFKMIFTAKGDTINIISDGINSYADSSVTFDGNFIRK